MRKNTIKEKLFSGQPVFGVTLLFPAPQIVEMLGRLGFDWILLDCEHGSLSLESVEVMAMAAEASGIIPLARPWVNSLLVACFREDVRKYTTIRPALQDYPCPT